MPARADQTERTSTPNRRVDAAAKRAPSEPVSSRLFALPSFRDHWSRLYSHFPRRIAFMFFLYASTPGWP